MSRETIPPRGWSEQHLETDHLTVEEKRFARFVTQRDRARTVLQLVQELHHDLIPSSLQKRFEEALDFLDRTAAESFAATIDDNRRHDIESRVSIQHGDQNDAEIERARLRIERDRDRHDLELLQRAWAHALSRLPDNSEMLLVTERIKSLEDLGAYLLEHEPELTAEEAFFLRTSIEIRRVSARLDSQQADRLGGSPAK
jgi:hypothetical protein